MEGITLLLPLLIIAVLAYFLRLPWMLFKHSRDVLWIWTLITVGCVLIAYGLVWCLKQIESYPHIGNYMLVILVTSWIYFLLMIRLTGLTLRDPKFAEGEGLSKAQDITSTIHSISKAMEFITFIVGAGGAMCFVPGKWGMIIGGVIFFVGMGYCYSHQSDNRNYARLKYLFELNPHYAARIDGALKQYESGDIYSFHQQINDTAGKYVCSAGEMSYYIKMRNDKSREGFYTYLFLIVALVCLFAFGNRRTSTVYVSTSETAQTFHYDRQCKGLNKTKSPVESIRLDELGDYEYYDENLDGYFERTPCKICSKE